MISRLAVLTVVMLLGSCATSQALTSDASPSFGTIDLADPYADLTFPLRDLMESTIGVSQRDVYGALLDKKGQVVQTCMRQSGYTATPLETPSHEVQSGSAAKVFGGSAAQALVALQQAATTRTGEATGTATVSDPVRGAALERCYSEARALPDPFEAVSNFITHAEGDANAGVETDPRVQAAEQVSQECIGHLGLSASTETDLVNIFIGRSNSVMDAYISEQMSFEDAKKKLEQVRRDEDVLEPLVLQCFYRKDRIRAAVQAERENEFIQEHGDGLAEAILEARRQIIADLEPYLPTNSSQTSRPSNP